MLNQQTPQIKSYFHSSFATPTPATPQQQLNVQPQQSPLASTPQNIQSLYDILDSPSMSISSQHQTPHQTPKQTPKQEQQEQSGKVTIFGFDKTQTPRILSFFSSLGAAKQFHDDGSGNWIHLHYDTTYHAQLAIHKNGCVIDGFMVGVVPYRPFDSFGSSPYKHVSNVYTGPIRKDGLKQNQKVVVQDDESILDKLMRSIGW